MRLCNVTEIDKFKEIVNSCEGSVWLESADGNRFNLKSALSQYVAIGALLNKHGEDLELFCNLPEDRAKFYPFFHDYPDAR